MEMERSSGENRESCKGGNDTRAELSESSTNIRNDNRGIEGFRLQYESSSRVPHDGGKGTYST